MGKAMRTLKTLWLAGILIGLLRTGSADEIVRIRHAAPQDYQGSWGAGFTVPTAEAFFQEASRRPVLEALTPVWEFYVDSSQEPPVILRRNRLDPAASPKMWGKYPKGDAFSNPLAAHGRIWLFARNQGKWVLHQAAFGASTPQWISAGEGPGGIVQFFLDEDSDPILVYMDNGRLWHFRRGQFTGGGQSLVWGPDEKITRLEAQVLLQTAREAVTRRGLTGEFDIGGEGAFLSVSCQAPGDVLFRYRSSPEAGRPYGPWSDPQSRETIPLNQRGRYFQYQLFPGGGTETAVPVFPQITLSFTHAKDGPSGRGTAVARSGGNQPGVTANDGGFGKNLAAVVEGMAFGDALPPAAPSLDPEALVSLENASREGGNNPRQKPASNESSHSQEQERENDRRSTTNPELSKGPDDPDLNPADSTSPIENPTSAGITDNARSQQPGASPNPEKQQRKAPAAPDRSQPPSDGAKPTPLEGQESQVEKNQDHKDRSPEKPATEKAGDRNAEENSPHAPEIQPAEGASSPSRITSSGQTQPSPANQSAAPSSNEIPADSDETAITGKSAQPSSSGPEGEDRNNGEDRKNKEKQPGNQANQPPPLNGGEGGPSPGLTFNYGIENPESPSASTPRADQGKSGKGSAPANPQSSGKEQSANQSPESPGDKSDQAAPTGSGRPDDQNPSAAGSNPPERESGSKPSPQPDVTTPPAAGGAPQVESGQNSDETPEGNALNGQPGEGGDSASPSSPSSPSKSPGSSGAGKPPDGPASREGSSPGVSPGGDSHAPPASTPENAGGDEASNPNATGPSRGPAGEALPPDYAGGAGNASGPGPRVIAATGPIEEATSPRYVLDVESLTGSIRRHPGWWGLALLAVLSLFVHRGNRRWTAARTVEGAIQRFPPVLSARERTEAWIQRINDKVPHWNYLIRFQPWVTAADLCNESLILMNEEGKIAGVPLETFMGTGRALESGILFKHLASLPFSLWNVRFAQDEENLLLLGRDAKGRIKGKRFQVPTFDKGRRQTGPRSLYRLVRLFSKERRDWTLGDSESGRRLMTRRQTRLWPSRWREERPAELQGGAVVTLSGGYEPILAGVPAEDPGHLWMFRQDTNGRKDGVWKPIAKTDYSGQECLMHVTARRGFIVETSEKSRRLGVHLFARDAKGSFNVRFSNTVSVPCAARYFALSLAKDFLFVLGREDTPGRGSLSSFVLLVAYTGDLLRLPGQMEE